MSIDIIAKDIVGNIKTYFETKFAPLEVKISSIEKDITRLDSIKPEKGEKGDPGKDGSDGKSVDMSEVQKMINDAVEKIEKPKDGKSIDPLEVEKMVGDAVEVAMKSIPKAQDGRDALDIEILPEIDETKSYTRGTYATHNGGLWRSYERTKGLKGWECIVDGVSSITEDYNGERTVTRKTLMASGKEFEKEITLSSVIYKGVWKEDDYQKGDFVTYSGSVWHCEKDTKDKPGTSDDWKLAVKRGRDGKNGLVKELPTTHKLHGGK